MLLVVLGYGGIIAQFYPDILEALVIISALILVIKEAKQKTIKLNKSALNLTIFILLVALFSAFVTNSPISGYKSLIIRPFICLLILCAYNNSLSYFKKCFEIVLVIVAYHAILNYIVVLLGGSYFSALTSNLGYNVNSIALIFNFATGAERFGLLFIRNQGLFWEPGVLQILMNWLVFIRLIENKESIRSAIIPIIVIFTTFSTSGYIILAVILLVWFKQNTKARNKNFIVILSSLILVSAFIPIVINEIKSKSEERSTDFRTFDALMGAKIAMEYPIIGIGYSHEKYKAEIPHFSVDVDLGSEGFDRANTNGIAQLFVFFGIPLGLFFLLGLYKQRVFKNKLLVFFIFLFSICTEPIIFVTLILLFLISGCYKNDPYKSYMIERCCKRNNHFRKKSTYIKEIK